MVDLDNMIKELVNTPSTPKKKIEQNKDIGHYKAIFLIGLPVVYFITILPLGWAFNSFRDAAIASLLVIAIYLFTVARVASIMRDS